MVKPSTEMQKGCVHSCSDAWARLVHKIRRPVLTVLHLITQAAVAYPIFVIVGIIVFSLAICIVGYVTGFNTNVDEDVIWTPTDSRSIEVNKVLFCF